MTEPSSRTVTMYLTEEETEFIEGFGKKHDITKGSGAVNTSRALAFMIEKWVRDGCPPVALIFTRTGHQATGLRVDPRTYKAIDETCAKHDFLKPAFLARAVVQREMCKFYRDQYLINRRPKQGQRSFSIVD